RVSLGWLVKGNMRLQAISHTEKIEKKMRAVLNLEEVMEEALDQDEEVVFPAPAGSDCITRCHERFAEEQSAVHIVSLPLRVADEPVAVLTLERASDPFDEAELHS
ncbi:MAG: GAF domain-containing protein, partial [Akkermansiaceae bacterium]|nr:GAF domain-containing protein [Akkermansiaceae bacterium]